MKYLLTNAGSELLAKIGASGAGLHLTRAQAGEGWSDDLEEMTELTNGQLDMQMAEMNRQGDVTSLTLLLTNHSFQKEHRIQQIGIFALDDETGRDVLFIVGQDLNGDILPSISYGRVEYRYVVNIKISNALNIVLDINDTDFLLQKTFYEFVGSEGIENSFYTVFPNVPYVITAMTVEDIENALSTKWDGQTSADMNALNKEDIENALNTKWDGQTSVDVGALTSAEIEDATN